MNTKNMKRWVLGVGLGALVILFAVDIPLFGFCKYGAGVQFCYGNILFSEGVGLLIFWLSLSLIFLSLLTYWAKDQVFRAWFNFAKWWVPVIIGVTLFVENAGGGGGWGMNGSAFDIYLIGIFYFIFIVVSLVKIVRAYLKTK